VKPAIAVLLVLLPGALFGGQLPDRARTETLATRAAERLQALHDEADRLATEERTLLRDLRQLELTRQIRTEELRQSDAEARQAASELAGIDAEIRRLEQEEQAEGPELRARLTELYKLGQGRYLRMMLSISDARRLGAAARMVAALARRDRDRLAAHQRRRDSLAASRTQLNERAVRLTALRTDAARARVAADRAVEDRNAIINGIDQQRDLNAQLAGELMSAQQRLQTRLGEIAGGAAPAEPAALPLRAFRNDLDWPVPGPIRQRFGAPAGTRRGLSNGIEIAAAEGTPALAIHGGTVAFADTFAGYGNLVIVDHGAQAFSLYGNLLDIAVARGTHVERAQPVGSVGLALTGSAGLYFELRVDGRAVDPLQWLKKR
jgi:septal ring factor EnvC (AmiA/AmiB activator)